MNFIKKKLTDFFIATLGIFARSVQRSLISSDVTVIKLLKYESQMDSVKYAKIYLKEGIIFNTREEIWEYCSTINQVRNGPILEFGVHKGVSINYFAKLNPNLEIFGFDSFEGLSENWYGGMALKGSISNYGALPKVKDMLC